MNNFFIGVRFFLDGMGLINKPGIRPYVIIPLLINIAVFVGLFFVLRHYMAEFNHWFNQLLPNWLQWLSIILWLFFLICFFLVFIYLFVTLGNIVAAPFNSLLSEKVELFLGGQSVPDRTIWQNIKDVPSILGRQFHIIGIYLPRALLILVLFFIPVLQLVAGLIWFLFNAWYMALTYLDYPTDNHRIPISKVRDYLYQHRFTALGFGVAMLGFSMIPFLNFFAVPIAVAGATKWWVANK